MTGSGHGQLLFDPGLFLCAIPVWQPETAIIKWGRVTPRYPLLGITSMTLRSL